MKCEMCNKNEAEIAVKQVTDGVLKELFVCKECSGKEALGAQTPPSFADFLFGVGVEAPMEKAGTDRCCEACGINFSEFREKNRLGCPECYTAFADELSLLLGSMHSGPRHTGKVPSSASKEKELKSASTELNRAVADEDFEKAAKLRDRIHSLDKRAKDKEKS